MNLSKHKSLWQLLDNKEEETPTMLLSDIVKNNPIKKDIPVDTGGEGPVRQDRPITWTDEQKKQVKSPDPEPTEGPGEVDVGVIEDPVPNKYVGIEDMTFEDYLKKQKDTGGSIMDYFEQIAKPKRDPEYEKRKAGMAALNLAGEGLMTLMDFSSLNRGGLVPDRTGYDRPALDSYYKMIEKNIDDAEKYQQQKLAALYRDYAQFLKEKEKAEGRSYQEEINAANKKWQAEQNKLNREALAAREQARINAATTKEKKPYTGIATPDGRVEVDEVEGRTLADMMVKDEGYMKIADIKTIMSQYQNNPEAAQKNLVTSYMDYLYKNGKLAKVINAIRGDKSFTTTEVNDVNEPLKKGEGTPVKGSSGREYTDEFLNTVIELSKQKGITKQIMANKLREIDPTLTDDELIEILRPL